MVDDGGSDIDGYLVASMAGPVKKKRGRPRKNPLPADVVAGDAGKPGVARTPDFWRLGTVQIDEGDLSHDHPRPRLAVKAAAGRVGVEGPEGPAVKRKRGRPRKDQAPDFGVAGGPLGLLALEPCVEAGVIGRAKATGRVGLPVKRGPGRRRKNPLAGFAVPAVTALGTLSEETCVLATAGRPVRPVKRKMGRPRKHPLPAVIAPIAPEGGPKPGLVDAGAVMGPILAPMKRKRGRPRKNPLAGVEAPVAPVSGPLLGHAVAEQAVAGQAVAGPAAERVAGTVKRKGGRPRKQVVAGPAEPGLTAGTPVSVVQAPGKGSEGSGIGPESPIVIVTGNPSGNGTGLVDRYGIGPANNEGIGFWPPRPDEMESVKTAAIDAGVVSGRKRGRKRKTELAPVEVPASRAEDASGPMSGGVKAFCGKCGTYTRLFRPARGPARRICPKCHPERMADIDRPRVNLDKTGMPCKDRGKCRPERCVMAFECGEMKRNR